MRRRTGFQVLRRLIGIAGAGVEAIEIIARLEFTVGVIFPGGAMKFVSAGLDGNVHGGAAGHALLGVKAVADNVDGFDRLDRRQIRDQPGQPRIADGYAIELGIVARLRHAVRLA